MFSVQAVAKRMQWVIDSKRVKNPSAWSVDADLGRTYVTSFLERVHKGKVEDIGLGTLSALAKAAGVSLSWLCLGIGNPDDELVKSLPPSLAALIKRLPANTYPEGLVLQAALVLEVIGEKDLPEDVWRDYLDGLRREARRIGLELAAARLDGRGIKR